MYIIYVCGYVHTHAIYIFIHTYTYIYIEFKVHMFLYIYIHSNYTGNMLTGCRLAARPLRNSSSHPSTKKVSKALPPSEVGQSLLFSLWVHGHLMQGALGYKVRCKQSKRSILGPATCQSLFWRSSHKKSCVHGPCSTS